MSNARPLREILTDREQWVLFVGHFVLASLAIAIVVGPLALAQMKAVAKTVAEDVAEEVKSDVSDIKKTVSKVETKQAVIETELGHVKSDVKRVEEGQKEANEKLDDVLRILLERD